MDTKKELRGSIVGSGFQSKSLTPCFIRPDMEHTYRTTDLNLAAVFRAVLSKTPTVHVGPRLAEFRFQVDPKEAQHLADQYYGDQLSINPRRYAQDLRDLKTLIFAARSQNGNES